MLEIFHSILTINFFVRCYQLVVIPSYIFRYWWEALWLDDYSNALTCFVYHVHANLITMKVIIVNLTTMVLILSNVSFKTYSVTRYVLDRNSAFFYIVLKLAQLTLSQVNDTALGREQFLYNVRPYNVSL